MTSAGASPRRIRPNMLSSSGAVAGALVASRRAMAEAGGNKTEAARLVGLPSYQTLTNWLKKYKV